MGTLKFAWLLCLLVPMHANAESLQSVDSRGVQHRFILTEPEKAPKAAVILLAGGHGKLSLDDGFLGSVSIGWGSQNNLVRTRKLYADHGFLVATMDAPDDREKMSFRWRMGPEHAQDIAAIANFLRGEADVPVWVIGTSRGSVSAANAGIAAAEYLDGIVLTSSVTRAKKKWGISSSHPRVVLSMPLNEVVLPVLIVAHEQDQCDITPAGDVDELVQAFRNSERVSAALFKGGNSPRSGPCKALSAHGFLGIEQAVVDRIAAFILSP